MFLKHPGADKSRSVTFLHIPSAMVLRYILFSQSTKLGIWRQSVKSLCQTNTFLTSKSLLVPINKMHIEKEI